MTIEIDVTEKRAITCDICGDTRESSAPHGDTPRDWAGDFARLSLQRQRDLSPLKLLGDRCAIDLCSLCITRLKPMLTTLAGKTK